MIAEKRSGHQYTWRMLPVMLLHAGTNVIGSFVPTPADVLGGLGT